LNQFILGCGAQKSGTTWLWEYLASKSNFNLGAMKEYHIWDALTLKDCERFLISSRKKTFTLYGLMHEFSEKKKIRYKLQRHEGAYEAYFLNLMKAGVDSTGDITPAYSGLSSETFSLIKSKLERVGFKVKVVFLMRDPFERCCSAMRMQKKKQGAHLSDSELLEKLYSSPGFVSRTSYHKTIKAIEKVFSSSAVYYGIYEEMFSEDKIKSLSDFVGVTSDPKFSLRQFNSSEKLESIDASIRHRIVNYYGGVYEFCNRRFPQTRVLWSSESS
jgi:hypothetical protein